MLSITHRKEVRIERGQHIGKMGEFTVVVLEIVSRQDFPAYSETLVEYRLELNLEEA